DRAMEAASWYKPRMVCPACGAGVSSKDRRLGEEPVLDHIDCACSSKQLEQPPSDSLVSVETEGLSWPEVSITPDRQMYKAQALSKSGLTTVASYYSPRNLAFLAA